ncbi:MAG: hypothetical protein L0312_10055, partial [Acidobacteria bacterium]|nr:hypothetical protein [Acidobacteriota bacterium]
SKSGFQTSLTNGSVGCGGGTLEFSVTVTDLPQLTSVSSANYKSPLAGEMITSAFGANLATTVECATLPLKTMLGGRSVIIKDAQGVEKSALMLFVSPIQINYVAPRDLNSGTATVKLIDEGGVAISIGFAEILRLSPGIFTADASGQGVPAAVIVRVKPGNVEITEPVAQFDEAQKKFVPIALDLGPESEIVVLTLFGTGWRGLNSPANVSVKIGGIDCPVEYAGSQPTLEGLDQINARLPRALIGKGDVEVEVKNENTTANIVQLKIR